MATVLPVLFSSLSSSLENGSMGRSDMTSPDDLEVFREPGDDVYEEMVRAHHPDPEGFLKGKYDDYPYQRPRIDWLRTWAPFMPFWIGVVVGALGMWLVK